MPKRQKTDEARLKEKRGIGRGKEYCPWLKVREVSSTGRVHRISGLKHNRVYHFMSDLEYYFALLLYWREDVVEIREQYPLLPIEQTKLIANDLGIQHPRFGTKDIVMTTDFMITVKKGQNHCKDIVRTIKYSTQITERTLEKFSIEEEFFKKQYQDDKFDWGVVTEQEVNFTKAKNIDFFYNDRYWCVKQLINEKLLNKLFIEFQDILIQNNKDVYKSIDRFEKKVGFSKKEGIAFFRYLIATKKIKINMEKKLIKDFYDLDIQLN